MKKKLIVLSLLTACFAFTTQSTLAYAQQSGEVAAKTLDNWDLTRTTFEVTKEGLVFNQTEMGVPDNHAISILKVPFAGADSFEITFSVVMDEYVASGRNKNDVWAGIGVMGKPTFINWRNSITHGLAKDSPGLFTRFFNLSGDLRYEGSIYQGDYHTTGRDDPNSEVVDTWQLYSGNASCSAFSDITFKMAYDGTSQGKNYYNCYINNESITPLGEASFIDQEIAFPDGNMYLLIVMNTEEDEFNQLSKLTVKSINGTSYVVSDDPGKDDTSISESENNSSGNNDSNTSKKGCNGSASASFLATLLAVAILLKGKEKNEK
ncbi:MAG: hypothetical protein MR270_04715 [Erysipelotrichaceae bacterium]|nr:hypothetical protein [Erysipelotrichaceae bacterium]